MAGHSWFVGRGVYILLLICISTYMHQCYASIEAIDGVIREGNDVVPEGTSIGTWYLPLPYIELTEICWSS
jgi:hypothetical protein